MNYKRLPWNASPISTSTKSEKKKYLDDYISKTTKQHASLTN